MQSSISGCRPYFATTALFARCCRSFTCPSERAASGTPCSRLSRPHGDGPLIIFVGTEFSPAAGSRGHPDRGAENGLPELLRKAGPRSALALPEARLA